MKFILLFIFLTGCASIEHGPYNREPEQEPSCWARYGAAIGYCGKYPDR